MRYTVTIKFLNGFELTYENVVADNGNHAIQKAVLSGAKISTVNKLPIDSINYKLNSKSWKELLCERAYQAGYVEGQAANLGEAVYALACALTVASPTLEARWLGVVNGFLDQHGKKIVDIR